jgi:hypothetical protein
MPTALPEPQAAYQTLFDEIHQRVFFQKMAAHGYDPSSPEQANQMLIDAGKLRNVEQSDHYKQAAAANDPYAQASAHLDRVLGVNPHQKQAQEAEITMRKAASALARDPRFYNAVLSLKAHEANQFQQQYGRSHAA